MALNLKRFSHRHILHLISVILHVSFEAMTTFQHAAPPFYQSVLFSVGRAQSAVLFPVLSALSSSHRPSQGSVSSASDRFCAFFFFFMPSLPLSLWMGRCEAHGPSRGRVGKQNLFTRNAKRKESWREGWLDEGRGAGLHLM